MEKEEKKQWANPTPAGLVALAVACACFFASLCGLVDKTAAPLIGCWLIGGFVVQLVVGIIDIKGGNMTGGNTFLFFSAFFMLVGGIEQFFKMGGGVDTKVDGYVWLMLTIILFLWTPAFFKPKFTMLSIIVVCLDIALPFIAAVDLGGAANAPWLAYIPGVALLLAGLAGAYFSAAIIVNNAYGKKVLPLPEIELGGKKNG